MRNYKMKLGSLFDGSGGFPLAGTLCGITPVWASEVEPYPIAVTRSRFPKMKHLGDVSEINGAEIELVDIITFGSPCQDLSVAGKRAGLKHEANGDDETTRSGLFMEAVRIIKEMRKATNGLYPTFALWENVPGAFSSNGGDDFRVVLEELIKIVEPSASVPAVSKNGWPYADAYVGDGWSLAYRTLDAQYWGVPQRRRRIYLVADFRGERAAEILFEREGLQWYFDKCRTPWEEITTDAQSGTGTDDREREEKCLTPWDVQSRRIFSVNGAWPALYSGEDGGHGYIAYPGTENIVAFVQNHRDEVRNLGDKAGALAAKTGIKQQIYIAAGFITGQSAKAHSIGYQEECAPTLRANADSAVVFSSYQQGCDASENLIAERKPRYIVRRLAPTERARLQGFPSIVEVNMKDITRDELCVIALTAGFIRVDTETGKVYATRGPGGTERPTPIELKGSTVNGYTVYSIHAVGVKKQIRAHRLVWIAAHGIIPDGMIVDHINNDKTDNRIANLQLLTPEANSTKAKEDGCYRSGEDHPSTIITECEKQALYFLYWNTNKPYSYFAKMYGISDSRAQQIIHEKQWATPDHKETLTDDEYRFWLDVRNTHAAINGKQTKDYTRNQILKWYNSLHTDSAEYKMWGNGISLPTAAYVMQGIAGIKETNG